MSSEKSVASQAQHTDEPVIVESYTKMEAASPSLAEVKNAASTAPPIVQIDTFCKNTLNLGLVERQSESNECNSDESEE